ncbi:MAG: glycosyltransferase [Puniceicoccaceae bacterium]
MSPYVEPVSLLECDLIHSVWWRGLLQIPRDILRKKAVVASIADSPATVLSTPAFLPLRDTVTCWMVEYASAVDVFTRVGLRAMRFPDPIDFGQFAPPANRVEAKAKFCQQHGLEPDCFLVGNFHRDSSMLDLSKPKKQKGADLFLEIVDTVYRLRPKLRVVLAGPRRHWIRKGLRERGIPFVFLGTESEADDLALNTLSLDAVAAIYRCLDLYLITSRWEGAPNALLEAAATLTPILSTPVGQSPDILQERLIFHGFRDGVEKLIDAIDGEAWLNQVEAARETILRWNADQSLAERLRQIYHLTMELHDMPRFSASRRALVHLRHNRYLRKVARWTRPKLPDLKDLKISLWNDFRPPPYGGGNQFMMALEAEFQRRGIQTVRNEGRGAHAHLLQAIWFDRERFLKERSESSVVLHRIDGPIQLYRGEGFAKDDDDCFALNREVADATVMQGLWSYLATCDLGYRPYRPTIIGNAPNPEIFHRSGRLTRPNGAKIRIISSSWSDNPRKGAEMYRYLDEHLDTERYEYTFVGRISATFRNIRVVEPLPSEELAALLREHDIYLTASQRDPSSNALAEALSCGLVALYFNDGGHPEIAGFGGLAFSSGEEANRGLDYLAEHLNHYRALIWPLTIAEVADAYLQLIETTLTFK